MFGFIASKLKQFVEREEGLKEGSNETRALGFTFSFPIKQSSVSSGVLIKWTKGFSIKDAVSYLSLFLVPSYLWGISLVFMAFSNSNWFRVSVNSR